MTIQEFQNDLFGLLATRLRELGFEVEVVADGEAAGSAQLGNTLLFLLPITEDDDRALTDLRFVIIDEERSYVQLYMTIFTELGEGGYRELEKALSLLNYRSALGAYGMFEPKREFFCKYNYPVRDFDMIDGPQGFAVALLDILDIMREQQTAIYDDIAALASGELSYEQLTNEGR